MFFACLDFKNVYIVKALYHDFIFEFSKEYFMAYLLKTKISFSKIKIYKK